MLDIRLMLSAARAGPATNAAIAAAAISFFILISKARAPLVRAYCRARRPTSATAAIFSGRSHLHVARRRFRHLCKGAERANRVAAEHANCLQISTDLIRRRDVVRKAIESQPGA